MDNSLKKIISEGLASISKAFNSGKSTDDALGIDIGSSSIKVVQLKKKNGKYQNIRIRIFVRSCLI